MKKIITTATFILLSTFSFAQVGIETTTPDASAKLDINANGSAVGLLLPRLTAAQRDANLKTPTAGLFFYNSTINALFVATSYPYWANILNGTTWAVPTGTSTSTGKIGIGTTSPDANAILDVSSTTKGVLLPKASTDPTGVAGMIYYNTTDDRVKLYNGTIWTYLTNSPTSNGTAKVSGYSCATATAGTLIAGTVVSGVTQTITATVTTVGTYFISTTANGVTFAASGIFAGTGAQDIILLATGTPTVDGSNIYTLNTTPNCNFTRTTVTVPGVPTIGTATPGNAQASVAFTAPASTGGSAITNYTVTSTPGSFTGTGASSPIIVTGLTNGTSYTFTVIAANVAGNSVASAASTAVTARTVPGAPTIGTATPGNGSTTLAFTAPTSDGGSTITSYTAYASATGFPTISASISQAGSGQITISGLTNGRSYTYTVIASNVAGQGTASAGVTPTQFTLLVAGGSYQGGIIIDVTSNSPQTGTVISFGGVSGTNTINCNSNQLNYANAAAACSASTFSGYTWRLPTITELQYFYNNRAAVQTTLGGSCSISNDNYWSSTFNSSNGGGYESIQFSSGVMSVQNSGSSLRTWAVHNF